MNIIQKLPVELQENIIEYVPPDKHKLYFYLLPMVFYNKKESTYVCFDLDKTDRDIFQIFNNFCRIKKNMYLIKKDWELVYTPWYRKCQHDQAVNFTFGCLPKSRIYQLFIYHMGKNSLNISIVLTSICVGILYFYNSFVWDYF